MNAWLVYGRTEYAEPLTERGRLAAASADAAIEAVRVEFKADWVELVLVPEGVVEWIIGPSAPREPAS